MSSWSAIVGAPGTHKGRAAQKLAQQLTTRGLKVAGFVQIDVLDAAGEELGWDVVSVAEPPRSGILARASQTPDLCGYAFEDAGFALAKDFASETADVVIVGNLGKLEAAKLGHWPLLEALVAQSDGPHVVACVRDSCLATIALALPDPVDYVELPTDDDTLADFAERLSGVVSGR